MSQPTPCPPKLVLVTGSSGHLGTALMHTLPSLGYTPIGIDILPSSTTTHIGSIADPVFLTSIFNQYTFHSILHTATLHKPHVGSHTKSDFISVNITGTTLLLEYAAAAKCSSFIFTSSTTTFGRALSPQPGQPAAWITESVTPKPKNIYGVTKVAAEDICELVHRQIGLPVIVLRTSRFFPEQDDVAERREGWTDDNLKVNELCYRRVDLADVVSAHVAAMSKAASGDVKWGKYIISAPTPFTSSPETLQLLDSNASEALKAAVPGYVNVYEKLGWKFLDRVDRVYDSSLAVRELGWRPAFTFQRALECVARGEEWRSEVARKVGRRGYHAVPTGVYTT
ncbi:NAD dependent epimerase/dehydratase family protein, partial [Cadophora sp. DSE1049]